MVDQFYTILTKIGKYKIANASALGTKLNLVKFQVGDSKGNYYNPTEEQTALKNKVWEGNINSVTIDKNNPNWIVIEVLLPSNVGGFMIREAAILDDENNIIAIAKYPETYKPITTEGTSTDLLIRTILEVSNAANVTLKVDPTVIVASKNDIEILENKIKDISEKVTVINSQIGDLAYQVPQIVGTQIRLIKKSDTKRLYFKLDSDLNGTINISLDGGATSKPLVDIDSKQINRIEKGFVEVVADADFFILRNRGGVSASDKQALIDIVNNAQANNDSLKTNVSNALNSKIGTSLTSGSAWNDILNAINGSSVKRWAQITIPDQTAPANGSIVYTVSGLAFTPSFIIVSSVLDTYYYYEFAYFKDTDGTWRKSSLRSDMYTILLDNTPNTSFNLRFYQTNGYGVFYKNIRCWVFE